MNTTVSVTYQFLKEKIHIFSQFLYDEQIKSKLYKSVRSYTETKDKNNSRFQHDEAKAMIDYMKTLPGNDNPKELLFDKFRNLITEIGNSIGYVRMIRSGGLLYTSNAIRFVPDLNNINTFNDMVTKRRNSFFKRYYREF